LQKEDQCRNLPVLILFHLIGSQELQDQLPVCYHKAFLQMSACYILKPQYGRTLAAVDPGVFLLNKNIPEIPDFNYIHGLYTVRRIKHPEKFVYSQHEPGFIRLRW